MREFGRPPVLIEEPAEIEYRDGMFYVVDAAGSRAVRRHIFLHNFRRSAEAIQQSYAVGGAEIVPFPKDIAKH